MTALHPALAALLLATTDGAATASACDLAAAGAHDELARFYRERECRLAWFSGPAPTPQGRALAAMLRRADRKGLRPEDYGGAGWETRLAAAGSGAVSPDDVLRTDVALTAAALRYVSDLHAGRVDPRRLGFEVRGRNGSHQRPSVLLAPIVSAEDVPGAVEAVEPPYRGYRRTVRALEQHLDLARDGEPPPADAPPRSAGAGPPAPAASAAPPLARRIVQLQLALERWRWLPRDGVRPAVVVNLPEFRLRAGDAGQRWSMKVVVGKAYQRQTPVLASEIRSVVFRPAWKVPLRIQRTELVAQLRKKPALLERDAYEVVDRRWQPVDTAGRTPDETLDLLGSGALRLRQRPGPRNALGLVKFSFPNEHDVYLHDTPTRRLFDRGRRDLSHGCIRVEDPVRLAEWVLRDRPGWTRERILAAMKGSSTLEVRVPRPVPIFILYGTAVVDEDGTVRFLDDVYRHDEALERALASRSAPGG